MQKVTVKVHTNSKIVKYLFPKWVTGFTFGRNVFFRTTPTDTLLRHETIHVMQYEKYGIFGFLWEYFIAEFNVPYLEKTFEVEAYGNQNNVNYITMKYGSTVEIVYDYV